jgi:diguanylate cyclase (GGDEF)-like protein
MEILKKRSGEKEPHTLGEALERIGKLEEELVKAKALAMIDSLTGLKTRKYFEKEVGREIEAMNLNWNRRQESPRYEHIVILFLDIDDFKSINDRWGHKIGDDVLKEMARVIESKLRDTDIVARYGGEEIVIALLGASEEEAREIAEEKIRKIIEDSVAENVRKNNVSREVEMADLRVTVSIGLHPVIKGLSLEEAISGADKAMYGAKNRGRNQIVSFDELTPKERAGVRK